jgi:two-component system cell cycle sensor histidine kinase/response regulator CckA
MYMPTKAPYEELVKRIKGLEKENSILKTRQETAQALLHAPAFTLVLIDKKGTVLDSNKATSKQLGLTHENFIGSCFWDHFPPEIKQFRKAQTKKVFETGDALRFEDGQGNTWHDTAIYPIFQGQKTVSKVAVLSHDITAHKQIEDLLRFQRDLGIHLSTSRDLQETLTYVLDAILQIEGIDAGGMYLIDNFTGNMNLTAHKGLPEDFAQRMIHYDADAIQTGIIKEGNPLYLNYSESVVPSKDIPGPGVFRAMAVIPIRFENATVGSLNLFSKTYDDIPINARIALETIAARIGGVIIRLKTEDMLHKYELIISTIHTPMSFIDNNGIYQAVNKALMEAFNKSSEEILGHSVSELFGEKVYDNKIRKPLHKALQGREVHYEAWFDYPEWGKRYVILSYFPFFDKDETISGVAAITRDITERKKDEELIKESEKRYRQLFEYANDAILLMRDDIIIDCNKKSLETFLCIKSDIIKQQIETFHPLFQSDGDASKDKWTKIFQSVLYGKPQFFEWTFQRGNRSVFDAEVSLNHIEIKGQYYVQAIIRDITERKLKIEEHIKASKLESIGTLAGGIAHDFNNILATIMGNIELAQSYVQPQDKVRVRLNKAMDACNRARELTRQFLTFSKGGKPIKKTGPLGSLIKDSCNLSLSGTNVIWTDNIPDDLWIVEFDENQIMHAFGNIIVNAREAMPKGGNITVSAKNTIFESDTFISGVFVPKGPYIQISFQDEGDGIQEENRQKIFDPYFSTKKMGIQKGMGLGLTTAYSIIKKHSGYIFMDSETGVGTTFNILLPAIKREVSDRIREKQSSTPGKGTILLMDDEEMILDTLSEMLHTLGYSVQISRNGGEAVEKFLLAKQQGKGFDAVILDLTIRGGMGGVDTMKELMKIDPDVKGVVSSGYSDDAVMVNFNKYGFSAIAHKPFNMNELGNTLQAILNR